MTLGAFAVAPLTRTWSSPGFGSAGTSAAADLHRRDVRLLTRERSSFWQRTDESVMSPKRFDGASEEEGRSSLQDASCLVYKNSSRSKKHKNKDVKAGYL